MAYRVECNKTVGEFFDNLVNFLTSPVSFDAPDYSQSQGNGNIANINFNYDNAQTEEWRITYNAADDKFTVYGTVSGSQADAYLNTPYDNGIISFTIEEGSEPWQDGDVVTIKAIKSTNPPFKLINQGFYNEEVKAEINGTYGYEVRGRTRRILSVKSDESNFIGAAPAYYYNPITDYYEYSTLYCPSIDTNHKINSENISIILSFSGAIAPRSLYIHKARIYLDNFTSDNQSSETQAYFLISSNFKLTFNLDSNFEIDLSSYVDGIHTTIYHLAINISTNGDVECYINGELAGTDHTDKLINASFRIYQFYIYPFIISFYYWKRLLSQQEIQQIATNMGHPPKELNDYYVSIINNKKYKKYAILSTNKFGFIKIDAKGIYYNTHISGLYQKFNYLPYSLPKLFRTGQENIYSYTKQYFDIGKNYEDKISKYWIVHDGSSLLLAFKLEDYSKIDHPVYQLFYLGWMEGDVAFDYPVTIGMKSGSFNWWETNDSSYRFGLMYNDNITVWDGYRWVNNLVTDGALSSDWRNVMNDTESISVITVNKYRNLSNDTKIINYGTPKWLYMVNFPDITPETEIYINGVKYVVISDNEDITDYKYLIKLEE